MVGLIKEQDSIFLMIRKLLIGGLNGGIMKLNHNGKNKKNNAIV